MFAWGVFNFCSFSNFMNSPCSILVSFLLASSRIESLFLVCFCFGGGWVLGFWLLPYWKELWCLYGGGMCRPPWGCCIFLEVNIKKLGIINLLLVLHHPSLLHLGTTICLLVLHLWIKLLLMWLKRHLLLEPLGLSGHPSWTWMWITTLWEVYSRFLEYI